MICYGNKIFRQSRRKRAKKRAVTTLSDPEAIQRPSNASQSHESLAIEHWADQLPVRRKGAAKPLSVDRFTALVSDALPTGFGWVRAVFDRGESEGDSHIG
jgi:hypothetical protein